MLRFTNPELNGYSQLLHNQAVLSAKKYLVAEAEVLAAIMRVDKDQTYKKLNYEHLTPYCVAELRLSEEVAGTFVRVARKSHEVPSLGLAVEEGLSLTKAKTIVSVITPENQGEWIEKAQNLSKANLEKEVAIANPSPHHAEKAKPVGENRSRVEFELSDEVMEHQLRAVDLVSQKLGKSASLKETQELLLECFLKHEDPVRRADRAKQRKHVKGQTSPSRVRESKTIPAFVKHQVFKRDRGCCQARSPSGSVCLKRRWVQLHHIWPRADGGADTLENLVTLCSYHHRLWHDQQGAHARANRHGRTEDARL